MHLAARNGDVGGSSRSVDTNRSNNMGSTSVMPRRNCTPLYKLSDELSQTGQRSNMLPRCNIAPTQDVDFVAMDKGVHRELLVAWAF